MLHLLLHDAVLPSLGGGDALIDFPGLGPILPQQQCFRFRGRMPDLAILLSVVGGPVPLAIQQFLYRRLELTQQRLLFEDPLLSGQPLRESAAARPG